MKIASNSSITLQILPVWPDKKDNKKDEMQWIKHTRVGNQIVNRLWENTSWRQKTCYSFGCWSRNIRGAELSQCLGHWCPGSLRRQVINGHDIDYADLTHWGRVTHMCVGKLTNIDSDNGLSPERRQAIIWTNAGILLIWPLGTKFSEF